MGSRKYKPLQANSHIRCCDFLCQRESSENKNIRTKIAVELSLRMYLPALRLNKMSDKVCLQTSHKDGPWRYEISSKMWEGNYFSEISLQNPFQMLLKKNSTSWNVFFLVAKVLLILNFWGKQIQDMTFSRYNVSCASHYFNYSSKKGNGLT